MTEQENLTERILKGSLVVLFFTTLVSPIGFFIRILYSRTLSIEMYGLFYAVMALFVAISTYNNLGFGFSVSYLIPKFIKEKKYPTCWNIFSYNLIIEVGTAIVISIAVFFSAPWLAQNYFKVPQAVNLLYIFGVYLIADSILNAIIKLYIGLQKEKYYSSTHFFRLTFTLIFSILFWFFDQANVVFYAIAWSAGYILTAIIYYLILYKNKKFKYLVQNTISWDKKLFKAMLTYAVPTLATTSIYSYITFTDTFFLTLLRGVKEVGIYNVIFPLVSISSIFLYPITNFILPLTSELMEEAKKEKVSQLLEMVLKIIPFLGMYFLLFIAMFGSTTISLFFGDKWVGLVEIPLTILAITYVATLLATFLATIASGMGKINERLRASVIIAFLATILSALLVFKYGVIGAVLANSIVYFFSIVIFSRIVKTVVDFQYPLIFYSQLAIFSTFLYILVRIIHFQPTGWFQFISSGIIYTLIVVVFAYYLNLFSKDMLKLAIKKGQNV